MGRPPAVAVLAGGAAPPRRAPAADHPHGDVAAVPRPGGRDRRRGRGAAHRLAVRRQHARSGGRRLCHAVGPAARARPPWCGARRRLGQPGGRAGGPRPLHPARPGRHAPRRGDGARDRPAGSRGAGQPAALALAVALRALRLPRAVAGDRVVPRPRRGGQVHRVHLRDRPRGLPPRLRAGRAPRRPARRPPPAAVAGLPAGTVRPPRARGPAARRRGRPPGGHPGVLVVRRLLGGLRLLPSRPPSRPGDDRAALRLAAAAALLPADGPDGGVVPDPAAGGARRPGDERPQGRDAPGREHRRLRRGEPPRRPRQPPAPRDAGHAAAAPRPRHRVRARRPALLRAGLRWPPRSCLRSWRRPCPARTASGEGCTAPPRACRSSSSRRTRRASWP